MVLSMLHKGVWYTQVCFGIHKYEEKKLQLYISWQKELAWHGLMCIPLTSCVVVYFSVQQRLIFMYMGVFACVFFKFYWSVTNYVFDHFRLHKHFLIPHSLITIFLILTRLAQRRKDKRNDAIQNHKRYFSKHCMYGHGYMVLVPQSAKTNSFESQYSPIIITHTTHHRALV